MLIIENQHQIVLPTYNLFIIKYFIPPTKNPSNNLIFLEFFSILSKIFDDNSKIIPINAKPKEIGNGYFKNE
mgnify:CR=1 FL=1